MSAQQVAQPTPAATTTPPIAIYNTLSHRKEPLRTIEPGVVRMYVCGVTPYDSAHIGHGMSMTVFDVVRRYLEHRGYQVRHAQNFTDIDDKIINRANADGIDPGDLTERLIADWHAETAALNALPATVYPRATQEIGPMIAMIERLIERGHAYALNGDVFFRVRSFKEYGKLSHRDVDDLRSGARIEVDERKEDPLDFALWKGAKPGEPRWPSPWGAGRPGWHIECSAMCQHHLGGQIDIHGGGRDLIFPHHENELAQSEAYTEVRPFVRYWAHAGLVTTGSEKMAHSLENFTTVQDILDQFEPTALRLFLLGTHYRSSILFARKGLEDAEKGLSRLRGALDGYSPQIALDEIPDYARQARAAFELAMDDDFNTPAALGALFDLVPEINRRRDAGAELQELAAGQATLVELAAVLGLTLEAGAFERAGGDAAPFIELLLATRQRLREAKQWALADEIRNGLHELGIVVEDRPTGALWRENRSMSMDR